SPAQKAGVQSNDVLKEVELTDPQGNKVRFVNPAGKAPHPTLSPAPSGRDGKVRESNGAERVLDPVRLSFDLRQWVGGQRGVKVRLTVLRDQHHDMDKPTTLPEVTWDESWRFNQELPFTTRSPISIPELGIAFLVKTTVEEVAAD